MPSASSTALRLPFGSVWANFAARATPTVGAREDRPARIQNPHGATPAEEPLRRRPELGLRGPQLRSERHQAVEISVGKPQRSEGANGYGSKLQSRNWTAGVGPCFHFPGFHFGCRFFDPQPNITPLQTKKARPHGKREARQRSETVPFGIEHLHRKGGTQGCPQRAAGT